MDESPANYLSWGADGRFIIQRGPDDQEQQREELGMASSEQRQDERSTERAQPQEARGRPREQDESPSSPDRPHQRQRQSPGQARAPEDSIDRIEPRHRRLIPIAQQMLRQFLLERHWPDVACEDCMTRNIPCVKPKANSTYEKCKNCSDRGVRCTLKWILDRRSVSKISDLTRSGAMSREEAERIVYGPTGQLGGRWDRCKTYPPMPAEQPLPYDPLQPVRSNSHIPLMAGPRTRSSHRSPSDLIAWPQSSDNITQAVVAAMRRMVDRYHAMQPGASDSQVARLHDRLAQDVWEAMSLPGRWNDPLL
ncbi:uncharacterized protein PAN0_008d3477 [Moesziomyces antarcticus]|uniref:Uncharacterized protein n=2 Tax=Pseudozyma antarctica TaxID=84753 RepID=A0A081CF14_PSEA2|nr:uncharacterized protein PAN0_008d3477 [Moesziomyces antarcticus]GAK65260.1 hypothetical protein PAN0_008d3477 [Moesziomyces antarcticus]SPO46264.1 uncharacterized protein PSANT_03950 [Moesziomyces antarcticus]